MDKTTKTILIVVTTTLALCACATVTVFATGLWSFVKFARWADQGISEGPEVAVRVGSEIADFEVPEGYGSPYGIHFGDVTMVGYKSQSEQSTIILAQLPEGMSINVPEMLRVIQEAAGDTNSIWYNTEMIILEQKSFNIRGQMSLVTLSEGVTGDGITYRTATGTFHGRGGPSLLLIACPLDEWDMEMVDSFIASIQ